MDQSAIASGSEEGGDASTTYKQNNDSRSISYSKCKLFYYQLGFVQLKCLEV